MKKKTALIFYNALKSEIAGTVLPTLLQQSVLHASPPVVSFQMNTPSQDTRGFIAGVSQSQQSVTRSCEHSCQLPCPHFRWAPAPGAPRPPCFSHLSKFCWDQFWEEKCFLLFQEDEMSRNLKKGLIAFKEFLALEVIHMQFSQSSKVFSNRIIQMVPFLSLYPTLIALPFLFLLSSCSVT